MEKTKVTLEQAAADISRMFSFDDKGIHDGNGRSFFDKTKGEFYINKLDWERFQVLNMLQNYFADKYIDGGRCKVDPITMVFTTFSLKKKSNE
jgi:hypothetical protein